MDSLAVGTLNAKFQKAYDYALEQGLIEEWDEEFLNKLRKLNVFSGFSFSFLRVFEEGVNVGSCGETTVALSFLFENFEQHTGFLEALKGSKNSPNGEHSWLVVGEYIYDTTLMLKIHCSIATELGYRTEEVKSAEFFMNDSIYCIRREISKEDNSELIIQEEQYCRLERR